jgi:hypothetical protein
VCNLEEIRSSSGHVMVQVVSCWLASYHECAGRYPAISFGIYGEKKLADRQNFFLFFSVSPVNIIPSMLYTYSYLITILTRRTTRYGVESSWLEKRSGQNFPHSLTPTLLPTYPSVQEVLDLSRE